VSTRGGWASGRWYVSERWNVNCNSPRCGRCQPGAGSHGPYVTLKRRRPGSLADRQRGRFEEVYLGNVLITDTQLETINTVFCGEEVPDAGSVKFLVGS